MLNGWQEVYSALTDFISEHPEVEIGASKVSIPENIRPEFYRLFNAVRTAFVEDKFPNLLNEAATLSGNYLKAEREVTELLGLDDVSMVASLGRFLHNPNDQLGRGLFDPLFDLLKAKVDIKTFEERASRDIEASFGLLYQLGYEKWLALSLVKLLEADKSFCVIPREVDYIEGDLEGHLREGTSPVEGVPAPIESRRLSFEHKPIVVFTVPEFIVHSAKVNRYISIRSQMNKAYGTAIFTSEKREWYPLDSVVAIELGLTLIYVADNLKELSLVADAKRICRPDLIIECREQKYWFETEGLEKLKLHHDSLKPILGTYIVSKEPVPEQLGELGEGINVLTIGFDPSKLAPIIDALISYSGNDQ